jgi:hypothetical protein
VLDHDRAVRLLGDLAGLDDDLMTLEVNLN